MDNNVCDEDNPAYCTPMDRIGNEIPPTTVDKCDKKVFSKRSHSGDFLQKKPITLSKNIGERRELNSRNSDDDNPFGFNNDDVETTTVETEIDDYPIFQNRQFECETFGYFAGDVDENKANLKIVENENFRHLQRVDVLAL